MKFYAVSSNYVDYLRKIDDKVQIDSGDRIYIGIILKMEKTNYFAPLSSPKENDRDSKGKIKKNSPALHRIVLNKGQENEDFLGKIKFSSMIPVENEDLVEIDIDTIKDEKYKNLLNKQIYYINGKKKQFLSYAESIYKDKKNKNTSKFYYQFIVDFEKLEKGMEDYKKLKR